MGDKSIPYSEIPELNYEKSYKYPKTKFNYSIQKITSEIGIQCNLDAITNQKNTNFQIHKNNRNNHNSQFLNFSTICQNSDSNKLIQKMIQTIPLSISDEQDILLQQNKTLQNENQKLKKQNKIQALQNAAYCSKYKKLKRKLDLTIQNKALNSKSIITNLKEMEDEETVMTTEDSNLFLEELVKNNPLPKQARRFSQRTYELCFVMHSYSPACYNVLRSLIPLPSEEAIRLKFHDIIKSKTHQLLNQNQIKMLYYQIRDSYDIDENEEITASIGIDAASTDPKKNSTNSICLFHLQPINQNYNATPIHITPLANNKMTNEIIKTADKIRDIGKDINIKIVFICTDGDTATNQLHQEFESFLLQADSQTFIDLIDYMQTYNKLIPVTDWLHLLKNLRSRLIHQIIKISKNSELIDFSKICINLNLNQELYAQGSNYAMRDDVALMIFSTLNIQNMVREKQWSFIVFLLPFVLTTNVIQSESLSIKARLNLLELSFSLLHLIENESQMFPKSPKKKEKPASYLTTPQFIRTKNTILGLGYALKYFSKNIKISSLGTHLIELTFGNMRRTSYQNDSSEAMINGLVKSELSKDILKKYNIKRKIRGRINFGGSQYNEEEWKNDIPDTISLQRIFEEVKYILSVNDSDMIDNNVIITKELINFLNVRSPSPKIKIRGDLTGTKITMRNIIYNAKK